MSTDVFCLKSFQGHKFMSNDHSIQFCSNNETFFCWGEMMTATSSSGKGWSLVAVLTFGVVNSFLTLFFFLTGCSCTQSVVLVLLGCCEHGNSEWGCVRFALWRRWVTDWQDLVIQSAHTPQTCHFFWFFQKSIKDWEFDCCQQHHAPSQPNWHALHPKSAVFCLLRLSGTLSVQSLAPLWSLIVSLLEAVFTSHFATKDQWTCEKTGDHFPQLTRCVKWNDWSILVTMWIFTQGKPKIAWGETLLSDFFISLSDLFTQAREHSQNNRSFHLMCRVDCQNKSKCHADEITGLLDVCRPNDKTPDWWQRNEIKTINPKLISQKSVKEACPITMQWRSWEDDGDHEQWQQQRQQATALFVKQWTVVIWCSQQLLWKLVQKICWVPVAWGFVHKNLKWYFHVQNERISEA